MPSYVLNTPTSFTDPTGYQYQDHNDITIPEQIAAFLDAFDAIFADFIRGINALSGAYYPVPIHIGNDDHSFNKEVSHRIDYAKMTEDDLDRRLSEVFGRIQGRDDCARLICSRISELGAGLPGLRGSSKRVTKCAFGEDDALSCIYMTGLFEEGAKAMLGVLGERCYENQCLIKATNPFIELQEQNMRRALELKRAVERIERRKKYGDLDL